MDKVQDHVEGVVTKEIIIERIRDKVREDTTINKFYCCINHYNKKEKKKNKNLISTVLILEYVKKDKDGNRITPSKRFKYTLFCTKEPIFDRNNEHLQLMIAYITGLETLEDMNKLMPSHVDISNRSIPSNNFYKNVQESGLFEGKKCYTGFLHEDPKIEDIPYRFQPLR